VGRGQKEKRLELPILAPLRASIDATRPTHLVYLATKFGKPRSIKAFGKWLN
jgi:hypothetical protein